MTNKQRDEWRSEYEKTVLATIAVEEAEKRLLPCLCKVIVGAFALIAVFMLIAIACYPSYE